MDANSAKPRVSGAMLPKFIGRTVCIVGKNIGVGESRVFASGVSHVTWPPLQGGGTTFQVETSDKQKLTARFPQPLVVFCLSCSFLAMLYASFLQGEPMSVYVELVGRVEKDLSLSVERWINFGADFGEQVYHLTCALA